MMALTEGNKDADSKSISSKVRWLNNLLPSTGIEAPAQVNFCLILLVSNIVIM